MFSVVNLRFFIGAGVGDGIKEAVYRIWCGANRLGDRGVHTLGDNSAFVNPAGQL